MDTRTQNGRVRHRAGGLLLAAGLVLACTDTPLEPPTYTVGGTVSDLAGAGLVLRNNGGDDLPVSADGPVRFATRLAGGTAYDVTVFTQPTTPAQTCGVTDGSGTVSSASITTVAIACVTNAYTVGSTVSGLVGSGLVLQNNGGDDLTVTANGPVVFATPLASGAAYSITVLAQPTTPAQTCLVTGGSGTMATANVTIVAIACTTNGVSGTLRVTVATTGPDAPATDTVWVVGLNSSAIAANGTVSFALDPGDHTVSLNVAPNCTVTSPNDVSVTVASGATTDIAFSVTCVANGTLRVTVSSTGAGVPSGYFVMAPPGYYREAVPANGTVSFVVASGDHTVFLSVPSNCTVTHPTPVLVTVVAGATTSVAFSVTCVPDGTIRVTVATTGSNRPVGHYQVIAEGFDHSYSNQIPPNGTIGLVVPPGGYGVRLVGLPQNCTIGQNPRYVSVASGSTTRVAFSVTCVATGTLRVTVATTGPNAPATYMLGVDPDPDMPFQYAVSVSSNGTTVSSTLPVGEHVATLVVLTPCFVTSSNPVSVTLTSGATTDLGFTVACHP